MKNKLHTFLRRFANKFSSAPGCGRHCQLYTQERALIVTGQKVNTESKLHKHIMVNNKIIWLPYENNKTITILCFILIDDMAFLEHRSVYYQAFWHKSDRGEDTSRIMRLFRIHLLKSIPLATVPNHSRIQFYFVL